MQTNIYVKDARRRSIAVQDTQERLTGFNSHAEVMNKSWNEKTLTDLKGSIKFQRTEEFAALDELSKINAEL